MVVVLLRRCHAGADHDGMPSPVAVSPLSAIDATALGRRLQSAPRSARWILPALAAAFHGTAESTLEPRTRVLLLLRVASIERSPYWRLQWEDAAVTLGVGADQVTLVTTDDWETTPAFSDRERAAILWGDRVARRLAQRDVDAYRSVAAQFDTTEIVELTMVASLAAMAVRITNALRVSPEPPVGLAPAAHGLEESVLAEWSRRLFQPGVPGTDGAA